jgi:hypothetical protein
MADPVNLTPEQLKALTERADELTKKVNKTSDAFASLGQSNVDLIQKFAGLSKATNSFTDQTKNLITAIGQLASTEGIANTLNLAADKMLKNSQELANSLDKARASYVKGSGDIIEYGDNMNNIMYQASMNITKFGNDSSVAALAVRSTFSAVYAEVDSFNKAQQSNYSSTMATITQLELMGVSATTSTNAISTMVSVMSTGGVVTVDSMKAAADSVAKTTLELSKMGYSLSESATLIQKNSDLVITFGEDALKSLAAIAKTTRIEMDSLVAVANKFDTFESAAQHVGKLNALLGSDYLSVTEMMFAEPAEQVKMISTAFDDAGVSVDNMSEAEKKYTLITVQNTLGLKSREEALKFLNADEFQRAAQLEQQAENQLKNVDSQERLNKLINESVPVLEKLANAFKNMFSILEPVFTLLNGFLSLFGDIMNYVGNATKSLGEGTKTFISIIVFAGLSIASYTLMIVAKTAAIKVASAATEGLGSSIAKLGADAAGTSSNVASASKATEGLGKTAGGAWKNTLALGAAILMIGAGIGAAAFGVSYLAESFKGLGDAAEPAAWAVSIFSLAMMGMIIALSFAVAGPQAAVTAAAIGVLLSVGAAAMMIGAGVAFAALGMAELVKSFSGLGEGIKSFASIIGQLDQLTNVVSLMESLSNSIELIGDKEIKINVKVVGDLEALKAISNITTVATGPSAGATSTSAAPVTNAASLAQPSIKLQANTIIVNVDNIEVFKSKIKEIITDFYVDQTMVSL